MTVKPELTKPLIVGLTGGIGSGKSTVTRIFADLKVDIIDADEISKSLVSKGSTCLNQISQYFGHEILDENKELKRSLLRSIIFADTEKKQWLENLLHPLIREEITNRIQHAQSSYLIISAPLLLESNHYNFIDRVLVIDTTPALQLERTLARDDSNKAEIEKIISTQLRREDRLKQADDIIVNNRDLHYLKQQVIQLHEFYSGSQSRK